ncbi:MAG: cytidine(C)-cytidine(C)-adenosine (A)]-adding enzyme [Pirellulaceae bacterium]|nr:MAG: cytidine(C)-cytidine(C)-adenosine (A)]-adding enzyme [Pirellulaceae bacterium]
MSPRQFAERLVRQLRQAGHVAYWAGGCVRDELLGLIPKDYDIATSARPEEVRRVLRNYRTLAVGQAFGVVVVVGPPGAGNVDVATFRREADYSDGRRPDRVSFFSSPEEDAQRRDFTINGLFYDPIEKRVIDYVGGQRDLEQRIIRAIGDAHERIAEDKLRMLRAIRLATVYNFEIDEDCWQAIRQHAPEISQVSVERVTEELRLIFRHPARARGADLLARSGLLAVILPEGQPVFGWSDSAQPSAAWARTLDVLEKLGRQPDAVLGWAALLRELDSPPEQAAMQAVVIGRRWRLAIRELELIERAIRCAPLLAGAHQQPWPKIQRLLAQPSAGRLVEFTEALVRAGGQTAEGVEFCRKVLQMPEQEWNPPPLITGSHLKELGLRPGPIYKEILERVRDAQLEKRISTTGEALALAQQLIQHLQHAEQGRCKNAHAPPDANQQSKRQENNQ